MKSAFDPVGLEDYYLEYINKKTQVNKVKEAMLDEIMPDVRNSYNQMLLGGVQKYFKIS